MDKASDFPARNVHGPRETANHRKRERERGKKEGKKRSKEREKRKGRETNSNVRKKICLQRWGVRAGIAREKKQRLGLGLRPCGVCVCFTVIVLITSW